MQWQNSGVVLLTEINIILSNPSNTVGLIDMHNPKPDFILEVDPLLLKQWADMVHEQFGGEDVVYISVHNHPDPANTTRHMSASAEYGDSLQVVVCGTDCDDVVKK
jgi:hypothetical protein